MKQLATLCLTPALLLAGCVYEAPLDTEHKIPIDPAALGLWEAVPEGAESGQEDRERMLVMRFSDTEYFVQYPVGKDAIYWRAYPIQVDGVTCVQLQAIGTAKGPVPPDEKQLFNVANFQIGSNELVVKTLNTNLIGKDLKSSEAIRKAFLEHKNDKELFVNPGRFRRLLENG